MGKLTMNTCLGKVALLATCIFGITGCGGRSLESARNDLLMCYSSNTFADWHLERDQGRDGFYGVPHAEREIISHDQAAVPVAQELMASFDHRLRCSGLTIISAVKGEKDAVDVFVEHLDDPYGPIRWRCWYALNDAGVLPLESMPDSGNCGIERWKALKQACHLTMDAGPRGRPIAAASMVQ